MFQPAYIVALVDASVFTPEKVKVYLTEKGLSYELWSEDGTLLVVYDNRPAVRSTFEEIRKTSDRLDVAERVKEANRCKGNIEACNVAFRAYQAAVSAWKAALETEAAYIRVRESEKGYLYGVLDEPRKRSLPWAMFHLSFDGKIPEGASWSALVGNIVLCFVPLKAEAKSVAPAPATETSAQPEGVTTLEVGPEAEVKAVQPADEIDMVALAKEQRIAPELLGVEAATV